MKKLHKGHLVCLLLVVFMIVLVSALSAMPNQTGMRQDTRENFLQSRSPYQDIQGKPDNLHSSMVRQTRGTIFYEGFEGGIMPPPGWTTIDADGDGENWTLSHGWANNGDYSMVSYSTSYIAAEPDNYIITPAITLLGGLYSLEYYIRTENPESPSETYTILVSNTTPTIEAFVPIFSETLTSADSWWAARHVDLHFYSGETIYLAFRHHDTYDQWGVWIDDIKVYENYDHDLEAMSVSGHPWPSVGSPDNYTVRVKNYGFLPAQGYTVRLMEGNNILDTVNGVPLESLQYHDFTLTWTPTTAGDTQIYGEVIYASDLYIENNKSEPINITVMSSDYKVVYIGNPVSPGISGNLPVCFYSESSASFMLYMDYELPESGILEELTYRYEGNGSLSENLPFKIYIAHTDMSELPMFENTPVSQMTLVYDGFISVNQAGIYDVTIQLDEPFIYEGGNLLMMFYKPWLDGVPYEGNFWQISAIIYDHLRTKFIYNPMNILDIENWDNIFFSSLSDAMPNTKILFKTGGLGTLKGVVSHQGSPLEGVKVSIDGTNRFSMTNNLGEYEIKVVDEGFVNITASKVGYFDAQVSNVSIIDGEITIQNLTIDALPTYSVSGRIMASDTNSPLSGVSVYITGYADFPAITTNAQGQFIFPTVYGHHPYILVANIEGYVELIHPFDVATSNVNLGDLTIYEIQYPPRLVRANPFKEHVQLSWLPPKIPDPDAISFSQATGNVFNNQLGGLGIGMNFEIAHRYTSAQLQSLGVAGGMLTEVEFYLEEDPFIEALYINIYTGGSINNAGTLVFEQFVHHQLIEWNKWSEIELNTPVNIPTNQEMWIVLRYIGTGTPFGMDFGPANDNHGNLFNFMGNWSLLSTLGVDFNFLIKGVGTPSMSKQDRSFEYYNIYRAEQSQIDNPAAWTTLATNHLSTEYIDNTWANLPEHNKYSYIVTSVYTNANPSTPVFSNQVYKTPINMDYIGDTASYIWQGHSPIGLSTETALIQTIYSQDDFLWGGLVTDIKLDFRGSGMPAPNKTFKLYLASTEKEFFTESDWIPFEDFTLVWQGILPIQNAGEYDVNITLQFPFIYGENNLALMAYSEFHNITTSDAWKNTRVETPKTLFALDNSPNIPDPANGYPPNPLVLSNTYLTANIGLSFDPSGMGHLSGHVSDTGSGMLLDGAEVRITGTNRRVLTDDMGYYALNYIPSGTIGITVSKLGYFDTVVDDVVISENQTTTRNFNLTPRPVVIIQGRVIGSDTNAGLSLATVKLLGLTEYETQTIENGIFLLPFVFGSDTYIVTISKEGYETRQWEIEVEDTNINFGDIMLNEIAAPPRNVFASNRVNEAYIRWEPPGAEEIEFSHTAATVNSDRFGTIQVATFEKVHRYSAQQLQDFGVSGAILQKVAFLLADNVTQGSVYLKIYTGGSGFPLHPGTLIHEQELNPAELINGHYQGPNAGVWNTIVLDEPITIPETSEMWIAIRFQDMTGAHAAIDNGPAVANFGNIVNIMDVMWTTIAESFGADANFLIKGIAVGNKSQITNHKLQITNPHPIYANGVDDVLLALESYNLYRSNILTIDDPATWTNVATNLTDFEYWDKTWETVAAGEYRYIVRAVYTNDNLSPPTFSNIIDPDVTEGEEIGLPMITALHRNFPNPFNPITTIAFDKANDGNVKIDIYNIRGQKVRSLVNEEFNAGYHSVEWNGTDDYGKIVASGIYFYRMETEEHTALRRMVLLK